MHKNLVTEFTSFIDETYLWLVMSLIDAGSCIDIVKATHPNGIKDESVIASIIKETLDGLIYFHDNNKVHRDIKGGNILMDMAGHVFLCDFGVSASVKKGEKRGTLCGSPCWMAPEIMNGSGHDYKADIWSTGITAIELAMGDAPYSDMPPVKVVVEILNSSPPSLPADAPFSRLFRNFVAACLIKEPRQRPSAK